MLENSQFFSANLIAGKICTCAVALHAKNHRRRRTFRRFVLLSSAIDHNEAYATPRDNPQILLDYENKTWFSLPRLIINKSDTDTLTGFMIDASELGRAARDFGRAMGREAAIGIIDTELASEYLTRAEETRKNLWKLPQALVVNKPDIGSGKS
jgi:hypothetical protein